MTDWAARMDALKARRIAAGKPWQIGRGERVSLNGAPPPFDYLRDLLEYPLKWLPDDGDLWSLPEPLRSWAMREKPRQPTKPKGASTRARHSIAQRRQAIARHEAGESYAAIAADLGTTKATIASWCRRGV